ncbi:hypothetical protein [Sphingobium sp.]|uniref:hypothetical protein n=1 Tax=Sphingobium sp. TaxID=1912891 RepID=UPI003BB4D36B
MAEPKPLAALTSGLLARKGMAQPAMRRASLGIAQDDLGWNDMGFDVHPAPQPVEELQAVVGLTPMAVPDSAPPVPQVVIDREHLLERLSGEVQSVIAPAAGRKTAFTLRLNADRHVRLRLACAVHGRSAQQIVTQALDTYLDSLPEIDRLARQLPHKRGENE